MSSPVTVLVGYKTATDLMAELSAVCPITIGSVSVGVYGDSSTYAFVVDPSATVQQAVAAKAVASNWDYSAAAKNTMIAATNAALITAKRANGIPDVDPYWYAIKDLYSKLLRTPSSIVLSLVGVGATGTQISAVKDSTIRVTVSTSTTTTIGGPATSIVAMKTCATNSTTEGDWNEVGRVENDQTVTLAIVLQSIQVVRSMIEADIPAGYYLKLVNSGTGTHTETFVSGRITLYG